MAKKQTPGHRLMRLERYWGLNPMESKEWRWWMWWCECGTTVNGYQLAGTARNAHSEHVKEATDD